MRALDDWIEDSSIVVIIFPPFFFSSSKCFLTAQTSTKLTQGSLFSWPTSSPLVSRTLSMTTDHNLKELIDRIVYNTFFNDFHPPLLLPVIRRRRPRPRWWRWRRRFVEPSFHLSSAAEFNNNRMTWHNSNTNKTITTSWSRRTNERTGEEKLARFDQLPDQYLICEFKID